MLLAIDPGTDTGWALFDGPQLFACGLGTPPTAGPTLNIERVLIELSSIRPSDPRPQDILTLAVKSGEWHGLYRAHAPTYLSPQDWKGSTPKPTSHARIWGKLTSSEQGIVDLALRGVAPKKRHNAMDAVGIGLHGVGRNANGR